MDRADDAKEIQAHRERRDPGPILDPNPRRSGKAERSREPKAPRAAGLGRPHRERYQERSTVERAFGRLQDELGGRPVRGRGHSKVTCHRMFGGLALPVDQRRRLWPGTRPLGERVTCYGFRSSRSLEQVRADRRDCDPNRPRPAPSGGIAYIPRETANRRRSLVIIRDHCASAGRSDHR